MRLFSHSHAGLGGAGCVLEPGRQPGVSTTTSYLGSRTGVEEGSASPLRFLFKSQRLPGPAQPSLLLVQVGFCLGMDTGSASSSDVADSPILRPVIYNSTSPAEGCSLKYIIFMRSLAKPLTVTPMGTL